MWLRGAETEIDWTFTPSDRLRLTYAYVDFETSEKSYRRLTARYSGSAGWLHEWGRAGRAACFTTARIYSTSAVSNAPTCA